MCAWQQLRPFLSTELSNDAVPQSSDTRLQVLASSSSPSSSRHPPQSSSTRLILALTYPMIDGTSSRRAGSASTSISMRSRRRFSASQTRHTPYHTFHDRTRLAQGGQSNEMPTCRCKSLRSTRASRCAPPCVPRSNAG